MAEMKWHLKAIQLQDKISNMERELKRKDFEIWEKDDEIERKDDELKEKDDELKEKDDELKEKDDKIKEITDALFDARGSFCQYKEISASLYANNTKLKKKMDVMHDIAWNKIY